MQEQVLDLYTRFKDVKVFYDFAFNPKEDKLLEDAKLRISKEYNLNVRKAKARRSVAQKLIKHFKKYRGYDPVPFLPVFRGWIVGSAEISDRFLYDYRKTVADCMADEHYGRFTELCREYGLMTRCESAGPSWSGTVSFCSRLSSMAAPWRRSRFSISCRPCCSWRSDPCAEMSMVAPNNRNVRSVTLPGSRFSLLLSSIK